MANLKDVVINTIIAYIHSIFLFYWEWFQNVLDLKWMSCLGCFIFFWGVGGLVIFPVDFQE